MIPHYPSVNVLFDLLDAGKTTSMAIVSELIARTDAMAYLNAYLTLDAEAALVCARELDEMRNQGDILGPLHGIPLVVKDNIHVTGLPILRERRVLPISDRKPTVPRLSHYARQEPSFWAKRTCTNWHTALPDTMRPTERSAILMIQPLLREAAGE